MQLLDICGTRGYKVLASSEDNMQTIQRYSKILWLYSIFSVKSTTQSLNGFIMFMIGKLLRFAMFFLFIYFLVSRTSALQGYSTLQALSILMTFEIITSIGGMIFREVYRFRPLVISGGLDGILTKPYHPFTKILFGGFDIMDMMILIMQAGIMGVIIYLGGYSFIHILLFVALIANAMLIFTGFHILALSMGIMTTTVDQALMILRDIIETGRFPIEIYSEPIRWIITFVIPVGVMMTFPSKGLFGLLSLQGVLFSFFLGISFMTLNLYLWRYALKRYQSWGG